MIAKTEMNDGFYYKGICRGTFIAKWDAKHNQFVHINYSMGAYFLDKIPHFEDVKETRQDGFIPVEVIENLTPEVYRKERDENGY